MLVLPLLAFFYKEIYTNNNQIPEKDKKLTKIAFNMWSRQFLNWLSWNKIGLLQVKVSNVLENVYRKKITLLQERVSNVLGKYVEEQNNASSSKSFQCTGKICRGTK